MVWEANVRTAIVQALEPASFADQGARLATTGATGMALLVLDPVAVQNARRVDGVGCREDRLAFSDVLRYRLGSRRRRLARERLEELDNASQRSPRTAQGVRWAGHPPDLAEIKT